MGFSFLESIKACAGCDLKYEKPPLSFEQQAQLLIERGMVGDRALMIERLRGVSYFRLSGYSYTFRQPNPANSKSPLSMFRPGTTFEEVWGRYVFDRQLRLLAMDAIERIEVALRSLLGTYHAQRHGLFDYAASHAALPDLKDNDRDRFLQKINDSYRQSHDAFVQHFRTKYGDSHDALPVWMATEIMTFGNLLTFYRGCHHEIRSATAKQFGVHDTVFVSWLLTLNTVRNICAHHGRLWNRELGTKPKIPERLSAWREPVAIRPDRVFAVLTICKWCLDRIAPQSGWSSRAKELLSGVHNVPLVSMGFPDAWSSSPIWSSTSV